MNRHYRSGCPRKHHLGLVVVLSWTEDIKTLHLGETLRFRKALKSDFVAPLGEQSFFGIRGKSHA